MSNRRELLQRLAAMPSLSKAELIAALQSLPNDNDEGSAKSSHVEADDLLLKFIDDEQVSEAFDDIIKWYA